MLPHSWVFAVEFSQPPKAYTVVAYSQSDVAADKVSRAASIITDDTQPRL